jgi:thiosulfate dehydrogenase
MKRRICALVPALAVALAACSGTPVRDRAVPARVLVYDDMQLPKGDRGTLIRYGRDLIRHTRALMPANVGADMDCEACHVEAGTRPKGESFVGIAAEFPQWNTRAHRVIALQDRLAECFLYSMNGHPPAYNSREMLALVSYITYLSRGYPIGSGPDTAVHLEPLDMGTPNLQHGAHIYAETCSRCHQADGGGTHAFPPLWGPKSFNSGAGMHRLKTMAGFVRYNMPFNAPGTLSDREAYDVAAYVLTHSRPAFHPNRLVVFPGQPAKFF